MATAGVNIYYHCAGLDVYSTAVPVHVEPAKIFCEADNFDKPIFAC